MTFIIRHDGHPLTVSDLQECGLSNKTVIACLRELERFEVLEVRDPEAARGRIWTLGYADLDGLRERLEARKVTHKRQTIPGRIAQARKRQEEPA